MRMDSVDSSTAATVQQQQQQPFDDFTPSNLTATAITVTSDHPMDISPVASLNSPHVVVMRKLPRQLKLSHSLSTFGFDGCTPTAVNTAAIDSAETASTSSTARLNPIFSSLKSCPSSDSPPDFATTTTATTIASSSSTTLAIRQPTKILSYLYLGSEEDATCKLTMETLGITSVLNVSVNCKKPAFIKDQNFLRIPVNDGPADKILPFFDIAFRFIGKWE
jgi:hypothetical protein